MSHHFESTWSNNKQKGYNCKAKKLGNFPLSRVLMSDHMQSLIHVSKMSFSVGEKAIRLSCAASFPADCDVASLPFYGGDNSAPAVSASCV